MRPAELFLLVPAGTPAPIVTRLHDELLAILRGPKFADFAAHNFLDEAGGSTADLAAFLKKPPCWSTRT